MFCEDCGSSYCKRRYLNDPYLCDQCHSRRLREKLADGSYKKEDEK